MNVNKPKCEACGCNLGNGYEQGKRFRKHTICKSCHRNWLTLDAYLARDASWAEFMVGVPMYSEERIYC